VLNTVSFAISFACLFYFVTGVGLDQSNTNLESINKVLASMKENGMDQLIVSDPASINYLMGRLMNPGERLMVLVFDAAAGKTELVISISASSFSV